MNSKLWFWAVLFIGLVTLSFVSDWRIVGVGLGIMILIAQCHQLTLRRLFGLVWKMRFLFLILLIADLLQQTGTPVPGLPFFLAQEGLIHAVRISLLIAQWMIFSQLLFFVMNPAKMLFMLARQKSITWWKKPLLHGLFMVALFPRFTYFIRRIVQEHRRAGAFSRLQYWGRDGVDVFTHVLEMVIFHLYELAFYLEQKRFEESFS